MASASQLLEPRHGAEGGAWGQDKLFHPRSLTRRGDRTGLEPQLRAADKIHMSVSVCAEEEGAFKWCVWICAHERSGSMSWCTNMHVCQNSFFFLKNTGRGKNKTLKLASQCVCVSLRYAFATRCRTEQHKCRKCLFGNKFYVPFLKK